MQIETRIKKGDSIGMIITDANFYEVMTVAKKLLTTDKIFNQLDRKNCKVSIENRLKYIMSDQIKYPFTHGYLLTCNVMGENVVNDASDLVDCFFTHLIKFNGLQNVVMDLYHRGVSTDHIMHYISSLEIGKMMLDTYIDMCELSSGAACKELRCANEGDSFTANEILSIVIRKYIRELDNN